VRFCLLRLVLRPPLSFSRDGVNPSLGVNTVAVLLFTFSINLDALIDLDIDLGIDLDKDSGIDLDIDSGIDLDKDIELGIDLDIDLGIDLDKDSGIDLDIDSGIDLDKDIELGIDLDIDSGIDIGIDLDISIIPFTERSMLSGSDTFSNKTGFFPGLISKALGK